MTPLDLVADLNAEDYPQGMAISQAGQTMQLLLVLKIANRSGSSLAVTTDSEFASKLHALLVA
ncbi:hypothetical protein GCM10007874_72770 [Labrys miyagiensis]|uniref:Uncharacterized protein n=1 Tax=Labrys miyagiensis TaxID=346912 RepID=A0ABQ6CV78_9HYPH|nr:hypothetical protein [Labrys miyagiensis]GLS24256.1 hypothetical protein GCM10007874_72770 [Labrys miyagiensis]